jgi:hypothetical protein
MKVLTVKQPWAWLVAQGIKPIENRTWRTRYRGPLVIQASAHKRPARDFASAAEFAMARGIAVPPQNELERGCTVALVDLVDCVPAHSSPWFEGPFGWVLENVRLLPAFPLAGRLGVYDCPPDVLAKINNWFEKGWK